MRTASFKKFQQQGTKGMVGISIVSHPHWRGRTIKKLFPNPLASQHKFKQSYREKLEYMNPNEIWSMVQSERGEVILLSDIKEQRRLICAWLPCEEL